MNSDWDVVQHQRNQEHSSPEVNGAGIICRVKQCSHYETMFGMVIRYLVSMEDTCRLCTLTMWDINIDVPHELYRNHHTTEKRPYQYPKLLPETFLSLFCAYLY